MQTPRLWFVDFWHAEDVEAIMRENQIFAFLHDFFEVRPDNSERRMKQATADKLMFVAKARGFRMGKKRSLLCVLVSLVETEAYMASPTNRRVKCAKSPDRCCAEKNTPRCASAGCGGGRKSRAAAFLFFVASVVVAGQKSHRFLAALFRLIPGGQFESQT